MRIDILMGWLIATCSIHESLAFMSCWRGSRWGILKMVEGKDTSSPDWMRRDGEGDIVHETDDGGTLGKLSESHGVSLFDMLYNSDVSMGGYSGSFSGSTLRDISEDYGFSLAFLGDYVCELGCYPPIDVDSKLQNMLTGAQIASVMECVNTLDPYESTIEYDTLSLRELVEELGLPMTRAVKICKQEGFNLPFGVNSILHSSMVEKFRNIYNYDEFQQDEGEQEEDDLEKNVNAIDVEIENGETTTAINFGSDFE